MHCFVYNWKTRFLHILIKMPHSKEISKDEIIKILQLKAQGQNFVEI